MACELVGQNEEKSKIHWEIGNDLLKNATEESLEVNLFDVVNHINLGIEHSPREDKIQFANLNLRAATKAKSSAAYQTAIGYSKFALELLDQPIKKENISEKNSARWKENYDLLFNVYFEIAEASYINTEYEECETLVEICIPYCKNVLDKSKIYTIKVRSLIAQNKLREAIESSFPMLEELGIKLPRNPNKLFVGLGLVKSKIFR